MTTRVAFTWMLLTASLPAWGGTVAVSGSALYREDGKPAAGVGLRLCFLKPTPESKHLNPFQRSDPEGRFLFLVELSITNVHRAYVVADQPDMLAEPRKVELTQAGPNKLAGGCERLEVWRLTKPTNLAEAAATLGQFQKIQEVKVASGVIEAQTAADLLATTASEFALHLGSDGKPRKELGALLAAVGKLEKKTPSVPIERADLAALGAWKAQARFQCAVAESRLAAAALFDPSSGGIGVPGQDFGVPGDGSQDSLIPYPRLKDGLRSGTIYTVRPELNEQLRSIMDGGEGRQKQS